MVKRQTATHTIHKQPGYFWVNGPVNCLARFTPNGYEIYRALSLDPEENAKASGNSLSVKVHPTDKKDWSNFVTLVKEHHGIDLSKESYPSPSEESTKK